MTVSRYISRWAVVGAAVMVVMGASCEGVSETSVSESSARTIISTDELDENPEDGADDLQGALDTWGIEHFSEEELVALDNPDWKGEEAAEPTSQHIENLYLTIHAADLIRHVWSRHNEDGRVVVVSGLRPPDYNKLVGGVDDSTHTHFAALDLRPANGDIGRFYLVAESVAETLRLCGKSTGLGLYDSFVHLDTGASRFGKKRTRRWSERESDH